ncbi:MAG: SprT-like domain-containing protein, partial [Gemmatimonadota bacterium]
MIDSVPSGMHSEPSALSSSPDALLRRRLHALGFDGVKDLRTHNNRTVMLTLSEGVLRIHQGYAMAPDRVLQAIVRFLKPRLPRRLRRALEHQFLSFPVDLHAPPPARRSKRVERARPGDVRVLHDLSQAHQRLNHLHFDGKLKEIPFRLSGRMKSRLGELSVNTRTGEAIEIGISRAHLRVDSWSEVESTVLHEMVHQWQVESGLPLTHGPDFRRKAREVGIEARAVRDLSG